MLSILCPVPSRCVILHAGQDDSLGIAVDTEQRPLEKRLVGQRVVRDRHHRCTLVACCSLSTKRSNLPTASPNGTAPTAAHWSSPIQPFKRCTVSTAVPFWRCTRTRSLRSVPSLPRHQQPMASKACLPGSNPPSRHPVRKGTGSFFTGHPMGGRGLDAHFGSAGAMSACESSTAAKGPKEAGLDAKTFEVIESTIGRNAPSVRRPRNPAHDSRPST